MEREELVVALKEALTDHSPNGWALLQRVPLICNDIRDINKKLEQQGNDIKWIRWLVVGIASGIGLIALKALRGGI